MKKIFNLLGIYLVYSTVALAQAPAIQWQKNYGGSSNDAANSIQQTADGGYIVAGYTWSDDSDVTGRHGSPDYWVVKLYPSGSIEWEKSLGGGYSDDANCIRQTSDGGYIVAGSTLSGWDPSPDGDVSGNHGGWDYWIVKLSPSGVIQWQKCYGGWDFTYLDNPNSIQQTTDGGYVVAGQVGTGGHGSGVDGDISGNHGGLDYWVIKINDTGGLQWQKCLGGTGDDIAEAIQQTPDGGYVVAGNSNSNDGDVSGNHGGDDYWIVKLNATGAIEWQKSYGGSGDDYANSIQQTTDGGYVVAGTTGSGDGDVTGHHGGADYWVLKLNSAGVMQWQKSMGGSWNEYESSIQQTTDGGYIVAGSTLSDDGDVHGNHATGDYDFWVVRLNDTGAIQWSKCLGGYADDNANSVEQTSDGGYIVAGGSKSSDGDVTKNYDVSDFWVVKLSPDVTISGTATVCIAATTTLSDTSAGGAWSSSNTGIATVGTSTGVVTGVAAGMVTISYTVSGNSATIRVTVNPLPSAGSITGLSGVCAGSNITLTDSTAGGAWSTGNPTATVTGGLVTGITAGVDTVSYSVTNTCGTATATKTITINPLPGAGTITGLANVCVGDAIILTDGATGGAWSVSNGNATVTGGIVTGAAAGIDTIRYTVTNSCGTTAASKIITVNPLPAAGFITGDSIVCAMAAITLTDAATGGTWSSSTLGIATVESTGIITGITTGHDTIRYAVTNICGTAVTMKLITVNPLPVAGTITGIGTLCAGVSTLFSDIAAGGIWSSADTGIATVDSTGLVAGVSAGMDTMYYSVTNSCGTDSANIPITVIVFLGAGTITGPPSVCSDSTITLADSIISGIWSFSNSAATITSTGSVTGVSPGADTVFYIVSNFCGTDTAAKVITVNPSDAGIITGVDTLCQGDTIILAESVPGGMWNTSDPAIAVVSVSGIGAVSPGIDTITYTVTGVCNPITTSTKTIVIRSIADCEVTNGIKSLTNSNKNIKVFPNPNLGSFTVMLSSNTDEQMLVAITDIFGQKVRAFTTVTNRVVDITLNETAGIYFLSAITEHGKSLVKVVVE